MSEIVQFPGREDQADQSARPRIMFLLKEYPQISQTYIKNEIEALEDDYDIHIVTRRGPDIAYEDHRPYRTAETLEEFAQAVAEIRPHILHTHYLTELRFIGQLSEMTGIPFTVRTHSFDTVALRKKSIKGRIKQMLKRSKPLERTPWFIEGIRAMESELCLGVLTFPFSRPWLERMGIDGKKLIDCFPVVRTAAFYDESENGDAIMNTGVATPKKAMPEFLKLAKLVPNESFRLYAMGYHLDWLKEQDAEMGSGVEFVEPVQPAAMPAEYKKHRWLVYTGDFDIPTVGWPMAIAEAQASGVGVCMPRLRPDLAEYVGEGAGYLYDHIEDVVPIVSGPVPDGMRERGFEQARKSDIENHKHLLTDLWDRALDRAGMKSAGHLPTAAPSSVPN
ncbi:glycosyltransferase family protein [Qipengyuania seohaensis]|uniref:glycosyltransferase n=1 Tax=Qipengyuania seohaensis TaxID=266951 RepID=UPI0018E2383B|nr:glycosyltransferase [Qipengyuania seohaensis]